MVTIGWLVLALGGVAAIVWGAETFAEHLAVASTRLGVSAFDPNRSRPDGGRLRHPWTTMLASLALVLVLAFPHNELRRGAGLVLLATYPLFVAWVVVTG